MALPDSSNLLLLCIILFFGTVLGRIKIAGFSLGSLGVLFTALIFGSFGYQLHRVVFEIGLLLFVYAVGLQAGPRFFRTLKHSGNKILIIAIVPPGISLLVVLLMSSLFNLRNEISVGIFSGGLTNTSSLAAALDAMTIGTPTAQADASLSYGLVYPFAMFLVVVAMQILPRLLGISLEQADRLWIRSRRQIEPLVVLRHLKVTNPNCSGKTLRELNTRQRNQLNISTVIREGKTLLAEPELKIELGDILSIVGQTTDFETMQILIGEETKAPRELDRSVTLIDVEISNTALVGKTLGELRIFDHFDVLILSVRRQAVTFVARGTTSLDIGDQVRIIGKAENVQRFVAEFASKKHIVDETSMLPFLGGLLLAVIVGSLPISLPGDITIRLGLAGGAFLTSVVIGHFGHIGSISMYVPQAAKNLCREFGLMLFLAAAGTFGGSGPLAEVLNEGAAIFFAGIFTSLVCVGATFIISHVFFRENLLATLGFMCGVMNNAAAFATLRERTQSDLPAISYTAVYPISLILKIVLAQTYIVYSQFISTP